MPKPPTAKLLVPRKEAEEKIKGQILEARLILKSLPIVQARFKSDRKTTLDKEEADRENWA
jgi:hypothetical protein